MLRNSLLTLTLIFLGLAKGSFSIQFYDDDAWKDNCKTSAPEPYVDMEWLKSFATTPGFVQHFWSISAIHKFAWILTGVKDYTPSELRQMCFKEEVSSFGPSGVNFNWTLILGQKRVTWECVCDLEIRGYAQTCSIVEAKGIDVDWDEGTFYDHLALTDNKSFITLLNCWKDGYRTFMVEGPKGKFLDPKKKKIILEHLEDDGFSVTKSDYSDFSNCH